MSNPVPIHVAIDRLFSRGDLPRRVLDRLRGSVLVWSDADRAYKTTWGSEYVWPSYIRSLWGVRFCQAPAEQMEMAV